MAELFGLTSWDVRRLHKLLRAYESGELTDRPGDSPDPRWIDTPASASINGFLTAPITGLTSGNSTPKVGTLNLYSFTSTGSADSGVDETVYYTGLYDATTSVWQTAYKDKTTNKYVLDKAPNHKRFLVRFILDTALTTTQQTQSALITAQYGVGPLGSTAITVVNLLTATANTYVFSGSSGDAGYGYWTGGTNYYILQMECS